MMKRYLQLAYVLSFVWASGSHGEMITRGLINTQGGSGSTLTIDDSGVQQLTSDFTGEIVISASNAVLDLRGFTVRGGIRGIRVTGNNVTVQNGIVRGATIGVRVEGNNTHLNSLDLISNTTGIEIVGNSNFIMNCNALNNSSAGFSLIGASRNMFSNCKAMDTIGAGNTYGFISQNGVANSFQNCLAENTQTSGVSPSHSAGFVLTGTEQKSKILNSQANDATGSNAYGMRLQGVTSAGCTPLLSAVTSATFEIGGNVFSVAWQQIGDSYYLAVGNANISGPDVRVLQFNPTTGVLSELISATFEIGATVNSVAWQMIGNSYYVAVGNANIVGGPEVRVLQFNPATGFLSSLLSATFEIGVNVNSVAWQTIGNSYYVAVGSINIIGDPEVRVLQFNPITGFLSSLPTATVEVGSDVSSVVWQQIGSSYYLAVGNLNIAGPEVRVLQFNPITGFLSSLPTATFEIGVSVNSVAWQTIGNSYYVAVGNSNIISGPEVRVLQFNSATGFLSSLLSATFEIAVGVDTVAWQQIGSSYYLAVGNLANAGPEVRVLQFNPVAGTLSGLTSATFQIETFVKSVAWKQIGSSFYLATVCGINFVGPEVRVLQFDDCQRFPLNNIIMQNQSSGNVTGFQDDASINSLNQWLGNLGANNTTNFNIGTLFPISAASGTGVGVTENIDSSLTTGGPAEKIMRTVVDQMSTLTGPMAAKNTGLALYGIVPITGPTTLSSYTSYCLANDFNGAVTILTSSFITVDLNQHTVGNIVANDSRFLMISNGKVTPLTNSTNGISLTNCGNVCLQNIDVSGGLNGLLFTYSAVNFDSSMMVQNCTFNNNAQVGFRVVTATSPNKPSDIYCYKCIARNNGSHGFSLGSEGSKYYVCEASGNGGRGFTLESTAAATLTTADRHNILVECTSINNTGTGFHMQAAQSANILASCYAKGNGGANYSSGVMFGVVTDTVLTASYWQNYAQPTP